MNIQLLWTTAEGTILRYLNSFLSLSATKDLEGPSTIDLVLPKGYVDPTDIERDQYLQVWLQYPDIPPVLWSVFFSLKWGVSSSGGSTKTTISGIGPKDLLRRRIEAEYKDTPTTLVTDYADDLIKDIFTRAFTDGIAPAPEFGTRALSGVTVQSSRSAGPLISLDTAWQELMGSSGGGLLSNIVDKAAQAGTPVWYDIIPAIKASGPNFELRTYTSETFHDATNTVVFSPEWGTLNEGFWTIDFTDEANVIYIGGKGQGVLRTIAQVGDSTRYNASPKARTEAFLDAPDAPDSVLDDLGYSELRKRRPVLRIGGTPLTHSTFRYGQHWDVGTRVTCQYGGKLTTPVVVGAGLQAIDKNLSLELRLDYGI